MIDMVHNVCPGYKINNIPTYASNELESVPEFWIMPCIKITYGDGGDYYIVYLLTLGSI
jgi:hypothetical protein